MSIWLAVGLFAQVLFASRFAVQWIASERAGESVMPDSFWLISLFGSLLLFSYAVHKQDPVFILGQSMGVFVYLRNMYLIRKKKKNARA